MIFLRGCISIRDNYVKIVDSSHASMNPTHKFLWRRCRNYELSKEENSYPVNKKHEKKNHIEFLYWFSWEKSNGTNFNLYIILKTPSSKEYSKERMQFTATDRCQITRQPVGNDFLKPPTFHGSQCVRRKTFSLLFLWNHSYNPDPKIYLEQDNRTACEIHPRWINATNF